MIIIIQSIIMIIISGSILGSARRTWWLPGSHGDGRPGASSHSGDSIPGPTPGPPDNRNGDNFDLLQGPPQMHQPVARRPITGSVGNYYPQVSLPRLFLFARWYPLCCSLLFVGIPFTFYSLVGQLFIVHYYSLVSPHFKLVLNGWYPLHCKVTSFSFYSDIPEYP